MAMALSVKISPRDAERLESIVALAGAGATTESIASAAFCRGLASLERHYAPPCTAKLYHGPGHQSVTECEVKGAHEIHEAHYAPSGCSTVMASWRGEKVSSGYFDEPPECLE